MDASEEYREEVRAAWLSPSEAAIYLGIGQSLFYGTVMDKVDVRKIGRRTLVSVESLDKYIRSQPRIKRAGMRDPRGVAPRRPERGKRPVADEPGRGGTHRRRRPSPPAH